MQIEVVRTASDGVLLRAPLGPNINHRETLFGGSASAIAILAAWSLVHTRLLSEGQPARIVIQRNSMSYDLPVRGTFSARSFLEPAADWQRFVAQLKRKRKARIAVGAKLDYEGRTAGRFSGDFVAFANLDRSRQA